MKTNYYIYSYSDPRTGELKYIGKGTNDRLNSHWKTLRCNPLFQNFLLELKDLDLEPVIEKLEEGLSNSDAYIKEYRLIKKYGRLDIEEKGILLNRSKGFEHFNYPEGMTLEEYLDNPSTHFNFKHLSMINGMSFASIFINFPTYWTFTTFSFSCKCRYISCFDFLNTSSRCNT